MVIQKIKEIEKEIKDREKWVEERYKDEVNLIPSMKDDDFELMRLNIKLQAFKEANKIMQNDMKNLHNNYQDVIEKLIKEQEKKIEKLKERLEIFNKNQPRQFNIDVVDKIFGGEK